MENNNNFIAVCPMSNFGGLGIISINYGINDRLQRRGLGNLDGYKNVSTANIRYNAKGEDYFIKFGPQGTYFSGLYEV